MNKHYTLTFLAIITVAVANAQSALNKQEAVIPITAQSLDNATSDYLPVFAGSQYNIEASFTAPAKKTTFSKVLKAAGLATATFQTTQTIALSKGQTTVGKPNWLIPVGLGVALGADKLLPSKRFTAFIQYSIYDKGWNLLAIKTEPIISGKKPLLISGTTDTDGFLKVAFVNASLSPVTNGNITVRIESPYYEDYLDSRKPVDYQLLLPDTRELLLPEIIPHLLPYTIAAESTDIVPNVPVKAIHYSETIGELYNNDIETPLPIKRPRKIGVPVNLKAELPKPVLPEVPAFPFPFCFLLKGYCHLNVL